jgi:hypothetical protein
MTEGERLLGLLESARSRFGPAAVRRLEGSIRAAAGVGPSAPTGDPLRYPGGLFIPRLTSAPWHERGWLPDAALLEEEGRDAPAQKSLPLTG